jgi:hypothetical protein
MSRIDILRKMAETNEFARELLAARQRTKEKVKIEEQAATEPVNLISDEDIVRNPKSSFDDFIAAANRLEGINNGV